MGEYTTSAVLIIPTAQRDAANALAEAMGWGAGCYSVPLSATGAEPATHYGLHSWVEQSFVEMLGAAGDGSMPPDLIAAGYPPEDFAAVLGSLGSSIRAGETDPAGHFAEVYAAHGLALVEGEEEPA